MKRTFLILCLITICNISYADIASVGYVDGVVATKQDTITDIETIRTGAGLGATAVQPSSLSTVATSGAYADLSGKPALATVATSGSYNDLSNKPTIPTLPTGPNDGKKYSLIWNGKTGQFMFKEIPALQCPTGQYDIGFAQCVDPNIMGETFGYWGGLGTDTYGLTEAGQWAVKFYYGTVKGIALCSSTDGIRNKAGNPDEIPDSGDKCWCKMTSPSVASWVFMGGSLNGGCSSSCARDCAIGVRETGSVRGIVLTGEEIHVSDIE